jgi:hypothetical protein
MRRLLIICACALALPLTACDLATTGVAAPATYANTTKADEQGAVTAELAYKTWRLAVETGVNSGAIKGQLAGHVADLDNQLYSALQVVEKAYAAGNSGDIATAVGNFNTALTVGYSAIGGR